ncbi:hypothetical protein LS69_007585 [Helicobacter sp. MIT 05-5294]|nr:hypothetical protein LS69_007585 [Helicobacter sp. MIT 05-5294]
MDSIKFRKIGDFCVYTKENHGFYEAIFQDFLKGNLKIAKTYKNTQNCQVFLVERGGGIIS